MRRDKFGLHILPICLLFIFTAGVFFFGKNHYMIDSAITETGLVVNSADDPVKWGEERSDGGYYTFVDEKGKEIDKMSRYVFIGDEIIVEDNNRYEVVRIEKDTVYCDFVGKEKIAWQPEWDQVPVMNLAQGKTHVGIYMTHSGESYIPTEGTESIRGNGGIKKVGQKFSNALKEKGVNAEISLNNHDPHDANAYQRSRRTAVQLLKKNPIALFDVHRDGVPDPNFYRVVIEGEEATKVRLVVGRQNPHMSSNFDFAKQIKAYYDKNYPGIIKGIYLARGNYNQDLGPRSILLEVGTYTNSRTAAEKGVTLFADGIPKLLGITGTPLSQRTPGSGAARSLLWLVFFIVAGGGAFLFISTGSIKDSLNKLSELGKEFANYFGPVTEEKKDDDPQERNKPDK